MGMEKQGAWIPDSLPEALEAYRDSDETALLCKGERISYRELLSDARGIASALMERGLRKGDRVVLDLPRSSDYLRSYLGVVMAGGVQVTIHTGWPKRQRDLVIKKCTPAFVIDGSGVQDLLHFAPAGEVSLPKLSGEDLFQIVYTSGSTGEPRGVMNCHLLPIMNFWDMRDQGGEDPWLCHFLEESRFILADANLAFGASTAQLWMPLLYGKTIVLATEEELATPQDLAVCMRENGVDTMIGIASRFHRYMEEPSYREAVAGLRTVFFCGEPAREAVLDSFFEYPDIWCYYFYASSEAGMCMSTERLEKGRRLCYVPPVWRNTVNILRQSSPEEIRVGETGEICIGGPVIACGAYWEEQALTSAKYVDHPILGRIFRSGDGGVLTEDGTIELTGRLEDSMTKLHGLRIETDAIEAAIEAFPGVRRAAVCVRGEGGGETLCAYYTGEADEGAMRRALAERLPYYMVPALWQKLDRMPMSINDKLDRQALPEIRSVPPAYAAPSTREEEILSRVFSEVLRTDGPIGIDDDFFALGGDSIRGLLASTLMRRQGYTLRVEWLFACPTIRDLARMIVPELSGEREEEALFSIEVKDEERAEVERMAGWDEVECIWPLFSHAREYLSRGSFWMVPLARVVHRRLDGDEIRERLIKMRRCHAALRSVFVGAGTERPLQVVLREGSKDGSLDFSEVDLSALSSGEEGVLSERQAAYLKTLLRLRREGERRTLECAKRCAPGATAQSMTEPLQVPFHLSLIHIGKKTSVLFIYQSHLLLDMSGLMQIVEELEGRRGITDDIKGYGRTVRRLVAGDRSQALVYWKRMADGGDHYTLLPEGDGTSSGFVHDEVVSDPAFMQKAHRLCRQRRVTLSALLHLAAGRTLMDLLGVDRVHIASTTSGRDMDSAEIAGMFIGHFPLRVCREDTLESIQHEILEGIRLGTLETGDVPYGLSLPGMGPALKLNVETGTETIDDDPLPDLMRMDRDFARMESEACAPPEGIDAELTLMVFFGERVRLDFYYSPASVSRPFVKRFAAAMLTQLREIVTDE